MILLLPLAFLATLAAVTASPPPWPPARIALVPFVLGLALLAGSRRHAAAVAALACLAAALALLRADLQRVFQSPSALSVLLAQEPATALRGVVAEPPVPRDRAQQVRLRVDAVQLASGWTVARGLTLVTAPAAPPLSYGDVLEVRGKVRAPEMGNAATYAASLRRQGIDAVVAFPAIVHLGQEPPDANHLLLAGLRARVAGAIEAHLPEPEAALVEGILVGQRASIPTDLTDDLNRSGTSHIVAISGFNVSIVVGLVTAALGGGRWRRSWPQLAVSVAASGALWTFVALVGASGSVLRAAAMAQLALLGRAFGRRGTASGLLLWGSAFLAAWQPGILLDVSWQLSFLGTAGLIWLSPAIGAALGRRSSWLPGLVREALAATLAAQICVLPVLATVFGRVSLVAPLANVLVLPLVPPIMLGGALLVVAASVAPLAAPLFAGLTWVPATALIHIVHWSAALPRAAASLPPWPPAVVVAYLVGLAGACAYLQRWGSAIAGAATALPVAPSLPSRLGTLALACLAGLACLGWAITSPVEAGDRPLLTVSAPAVSEGTLLLVQTAGGTRVLVDGGPTTGGAVALLGDYVRPWDRTVDVVVLTDPRQQYALGLPRVLERYRVGLLLDAAEDYPSAAYRQVRETARRQGVPRLLAEPGTDIAVGPSLTLEILGPPAPAAIDTPGASSRGSQPGVAGQSGQSGPAGPSGQGNPSRPPSVARATPLTLRLRTGDFSLLIAADGAPAAQRALLAAPQPLGSTVLLFPERATRQPLAESLLRAVSPELVVVQGNPPAPRPTNLSAGSRSSPPPAPLAPSGSPIPSAPSPAAPGPGNAGPAAPLPTPTPVVLHVADGEPEPTWHRTAADGPLRLEVRDDSYRIISP